MEAGETPPEKRISLLCRQRIEAIASRGESALYWLVGSPLFLPTFTVVSSLKCLHWDHSVGPESVDFSREADDIRTLLPRGLNVIGAVFIGTQNHEENAKKAAKACIKLRELVFPETEAYSLIGASSDLRTNDVKFFIFSKRNLESLEFIPNVISEDCPERFFWERGCLLRCQLELKLPVYVPLDKTSDAGEAFSSAVDAAAAKFRNPGTLFLLERKSMGSDDTVPPIVLHGAELGLEICPSGQKPPEYGTVASDNGTLTCSYFLSKSKPTPLSYMENADTILVSLFSNQSESTLSCISPLAKYFPAPVPQKYLVIDLKLDVLCYSSLDFPLVSAISMLVIPALTDQLLKLKEYTKPNLSTNRHQLSPYHFCPSGILHPITAIYDMVFGEMEMKQVEIRRSIHLRLGLPLNRPLLLTSNSISSTFATSRKDPTKTGYALLKNVHMNIPRSGISGGMASLLDGSYEYYHYLQNGINDNGWGCAYRSLQTIISWFRLQKYTSIEVPSHREIQQVLVDIGDKEPSFVGSCEWIGAIELSFVLDKLLGVSCKIMNVRSGAELPEKCRELALHFDTQGTPVMIGGGVLAYTLLGVDYSEVTGDCAFLILDPHYTGNDDLKKVVNGGWCGWKKSVDSRGKSFFLSDKFYNLLLPQRPNMV